MPRFATQAAIDELQRLSITQYIAQRRDDMPTVRTACNYGGFRDWFVCRCGRRAGVLYFAYEWRCRHCIGLPYRSQLEQPLDRLNARINTIRARLHWCAGVANGKGTRPKGMHQRTFSRLVKEHDALAAQLIGGINARFK